MTQEAGKFGLPSGVQEVALCVERLLNDTNEDLKNFRAEQSQLRAQVSAVLDENHRLTSELGQYKQTMRSDSMEDMQQRLQCTSEALAKATKQIELLRKERRSMQSLQECAQRTIEHMEAELQSHRAQLRLGGGNEQIGLKYANAVKMLESKLGAQREELQTQGELIKALHEHKQRSGEQIQQLQSKLKARAYDSVVMEDSRSKIDSLERRLISASKQHKEYEKSLLYTRTLLEESTKREAFAMRKVQDALSLSETAVREKAEAEQRAETYKEEATQLATNIGSIMDEAAKRVDEEVAQLKAKLLEKDKAVAALRDKLKAELAQNKSVVQMLETRNNRLELKYREALKQNDKLVGEVEATCKRLNALERSAEEPPDDEERQAKIRKRYECQMKRYILAHKEMKLRYKEALDDLTQKFEAEIYRLKKDNFELQADNELLRNGAGPALK